MPVFKVITSVYRMPCIELDGGDKSHHDLLRKATTTQWMDSPAYNLARQAGAFLQGQNTDVDFVRRTDEWTLVEFWRPDYQGFVDMLNAEIKKTGVFTPCYFPQYGPVFSNQGK